MRTSGSRSLPKLARKLLVGALLLAFVCIATEQVLEIRDRATFTAHDTFASVGGKRVRYLLRGASRAGPTIVLVPGLTGSLEQWDDVQNSLSSQAPSLAYDRAGMGFSDASTAHDADGEADELAGLLRARGITSKVVVVSFSASALVARVFAAKYAMNTSALVFIDPATPEVRIKKKQGQKSYRREFARAYLQQSIKALLGVARVTFFLHHLKVPETSAAQYSTRAIDSSFHHWLASAQDGLSLDASSAQAVAAPGFGTIPVGVFSTMHTEYERAALEEQRALAARSTRGTFRLDTTLDHQTFLNFPDSSKPIAEFILEIENQVRTQ